MSRKISIKKTIFIITVSLMIILSCPTSYAKSKYSKSDLRYMTSIIYEEAGNQCYAGKVAVGIVVMNRVKSKEFPNTIKEVLYQENQFTPARNGKLASALAKYDKNKLPASCKKAAKEALNGTKKVKYNKKIINCKSFLYFSGYVKNYKAKIGSHQFK